MSSTTKPRAATPRATNTKALATKPAVNSTKARLQNEVEWLRANGGTGLTKKRAHPKMTYTPEDIAAMNAEEDQSSWDGSSGDESD